MFINDLWSSIQLLGTIFFADDANFSYSKNNVKELFRTMNEKRSHLYNWFCPNKLSRTTDKTNYILFYKAKSKGNLPQVLPYLFITDVKIKRENSPKFLEL